MENDINIVVMYKLFRSNSFPARLPAGRKPAPVFGQIDQQDTDQYDGQPRQLQRGHPFPGKKDTQ